MIEGFPWTPHEATWQPKTNRPGGGREDSTLRPGQTLNLFFDPKTPAQAERYGVIGYNRPYLVIGQADELEAMMRGDLLLWGDKKLEVVEGPWIYRPGDGIDHGELMAFDQRYGKVTL